MSDSCVPQSNQQTVSVVHGFPTAIGVSLVSLWGKLGVSVGHVYQGSLASIWSTTLKNGESLGDPDGWCETPE